MKQLALLAATVAMFALPSEVLGQCSNDNSYFTSSTPACPGSSTVNNVRGGRYVLSNVVAGNDYIYSTCSNTNFDTQITLYNNAGGGSLAYNDDFCDVQSQISWTATFTGTVRVLIDRYWCSNTSARTTLVITCAVTPSNDEPCAAIALTVGASCTLVNGSNAAATATSGIPVPTCTSYGSNDVWFTVVVPASGNLGVETSSGGLTDAGMAIYKATACNNAFTEEECDDNDGTGEMPAIYLTGLVAGDTYYIRVWGDAGASGSFEICAYDPPDCVYTLHLFDRNGDGWNGSNIDITINGGSPTNYTLSTGTEGEASFPVYLDDLIALQYNSVGSQEDEVSYILALGNGVLHSDGPNPTAGVVYSSKADCIKPGAPIEDCVGGYTLCAGQTINVNPVNTGITDDLSAANRGCLGSNERQGQWYNFSPTAGGTMEMDIVPLDPTDDYDFAIWGPYSAVNCIPPSTPIRCSYSGDTGNTGLASGSGDTSEGPGGNKYVDELDVLAGEVYVMYVSNWSQTGIESDINFSLTNGAVLDCAVLPISLLTFDAKPQGDKVGLTWVTESETDNEKFIIERSLDGQFFVKLGETPGAGTSAQTISYSFDDHNPAVGINYYRLRQVDHDGTESYSQIVAALMDHTVHAISDPFPNPASDIVSINIQSAENAPVSILIYDAGGREVFQMTKQLQAGPQRVQIPVHQLQKGSYTVRLVGSDALRSSAGRFVVN